MHYFSNLFWYRTLHVSERFTVYNQESSTVYTAIGASEIRILISLTDSQHNFYSNTYCCVYSARLLMMDSKPVRNM
jgi:hypothetical protein